MDQGSPAANGAVATAIVDAVHAPIFEFYPELVREFGGDPATFLAQAGIDPAVALRGEFRASYRQMADLLELAATGLASPDFGMRLALRQCRIPIFGPLGDAIRHSRSFGEALEVVASHSYAHSLAAGIWLKPARSGKAIMLGHEILLDRLPARRQITEQVLLTAHLWAIWLTSGLVRARRIYLRHQPVAPMRIYRECFGCEVRFGQQVNAVLYYDRDLTRPIMAADQQALQSGISHIEAQFPHRRPPLAALARGAILHVLGTDLCTADWIAEQLKLHPRTLHRRLRDEGASFRSIRDDVRRDMLAYYLRQTDFELSDISERLGFSEQSVLTRCCHRWFSQSPTRLRLQLRGAAPES